MTFPQQRLRRLRRTETMRRMLRETRVSVDQLIYPLFVCEGEGQRIAIPTMPGIDRMSADVAAEECGAIEALGIPGVMLFGIPDDKDESGSSADHVHGVIQDAVRAIKARTEGLVVITDVCMCEYTSHGHCGILNGEEVDNDQTLVRLSEIAVSHAVAGADMVAPSDMMDGRVAAIRDALDDGGFSQIPIMSYAAKYASVFYGPFREAAESTPSFGDRRAYQMDPCNVREALREVALDIDEGADIVMVKPALAYLDVIHRVREATDLPVAAYSVSGEYAMIMAAAEKGMLDLDCAIDEVLTAIARSGADLIITYFAKRFAEAQRS